MSKKDYIAIASVISDARPISTDLHNDGVRGAHFALDQVVRDLSRKFQADNPRFDEDRFRGACRYQGV